MGREHIEAIIRKILAKTQEDLERWEKRISEKAKPHWWSIPKGPDAPDRQTCERLRSTITYVQSWHSRLAASPEFPADGHYTVDTRRTAIAALKGRLAEAEREIAPNNVQLTYSRRRYETNENGGRGPGRWVADVPGNHFDDLKGLLIEKFKEEIKALEPTVEGTRDRARTVERAEFVGHSRPMRSPRRSGNCPICGADPDEPHRGH
jgi:hypothetical protein